jgi:hypothetical protein
MSPRKPPRLADWLLRFFGFYRKDSPLAGDLLEEFESGRSAAWFWRQTLVLLLTGISRNARGARRHLTGGIMGWAVQAPVAFALWWLHLPPRLLPHGGPFLSSLLAMLIAVAMAVTLTKGFLALKLRSSDPEGLLVSACDRFVKSLVFYCYMVMVGSWMDFVELQALLLLFWVMGDLMPSVLFTVKKR